jgi:hypothetical protein
MFACATFMVKLYAALPPAVPRFAIPSLPPYLPPTPPPQVKKRVRAARRSMKRESKVQLTDEIIFFDDVAGNEQAKVRRGGGG